jgi:hypothetical protein
MPTSKKKTTATREHQLAAAQSMVDGIAQNKASLPATIPVGTQTYKPDDVSALLQKRITAGKTVVTTASAHEDALESDVMAQTKLVVGTFRKLVLVLFAQSPAVLATFGLTAPKPRVVPVATKAKAARQGAAKRKAKTAAVEAVDAETPAPAATPAAPPAATPVAASTKPAS